MSMKPQVISIWLNPDEEKEIKKLRKKADKDRRSLSSYCKKVLFETAEK